MYLATRCFETLSCYPQINIISVAMQEIFVQWKACTLQKVNHFFNMSSLLLQLQTSFILLPSLHVWYKKAIIVYYLFDIHMILTLILPGITLLHA